jgi:hypothetical protein
LYDLFWELDDRLGDDLDIWFWMPIDDVAGVAWPFDSYIDVDLLFKPDFLTRDPMDPANWDIAATVAHEIVHLGQDMWEKMSIQGEAKAYQMQGKIIDALNRNRPEGFDPLGKSRYTQEVEDLDLTAIGSVMEAHRRFRGIEGNSYNWQPVFPADQWWFEKWWLQVGVTTTDIFQGIFGGN